MTNVMNREQVAGFDKKAQEIHEELPNMVNNIAEDPVLKDTLLQAERGSDMVPNTMPSSDATATIMINGILFPQRTRLPAEDLADTRWDDLTRSQKQNHRARIRAHQKAWETRWAKIKEDKGFSGDLTEDEKRVVRQGIVRERTKMTHEAEE
eukprot:12920671-Prorocentrum_lima.AAC.1